MRLNGNIKCSRLRRAQRVLCEVEQQNDSIFAAGWNVVIWQTLVFMFKTRVSTQTRRICRVWRDKVCNYKHILNWEILLVCFFSHVSMASSFLSVQCLQDSRRLALLTSCDALTRGGTWWVKIWISHDWSIKTWTSWWLSHQFYYTIKITLWWLNHENM